MVLTKLDVNKVSVSPVDEAPTVNGQADSSTESIEKDPELDPAEEVTENGPTGNANLPVP